MKDGYIPVFTATTRVDDVRIGRPSHPITINATVVITDVVRGSIMLHEKVGKRTGVHVCHKTVCSTGKMQ